MLRHHILLRNTSILWKYGLPNLVNHFFLILNNAINNEHGLVKQLHFFPIRTSRY